MPERREHLTGLTGPLTLRVTSTGVSGCQVTIVTDPDVTSPELTFRGGADQSR